MHFITNGYKRFTKTNSTDPRQHVPLRTQVSRRVLNQAPKIHKAEEKTVKDTKSHMAHMTWYICW